MPKKLIIVKAVEPAPAIDTSKLTDDELVAEMKKRFIVPQFYTRERIVEFITDAGIEAEEKKIDEFIEMYKSDVYCDIDDSLIGHIENWFL